MRSPDKHVSYGYVL